MSLSRLEFHKSPEIEFATLVFIDVPIILMYEDTPLIEVVQRETDGFLLGLKIFDSQGTAIASILGQNIVLTDAGRDANLSLTPHQDVVVCSLENETLFEFECTDGVHSRLQAELFTPDGRFVRFRELPEPVCDIIHLGKLEKSIAQSLSNFAVTGGDIGIHLKQGEMRLGGSIQ